MAENRVERLLWLAAAGAAKKFRRAVVKDVRKLLWVGCYGGVLAGWGADAHVQASMSASRSRERV